MKQAIIVDESLKLPRGKLAAQVAHAAVGAFIKADEAARQSWVEEGMSKVVLRVASKDDLIRLYNLAQARNIPTCLIQDAGKTVVPAGTVTCLGLGPAAIVEIDELTGELKLLR